MKRISLIIFCALLQMGLTFSQSWVEFGVTSGTEINIPSSANNSNIKDYSVMPGFNLGFRIQHNFNQKLSLFGGIEYARMNYLFHQYPNSAFIGPYQENISLVANQIRVPFLFQVNVGKKRSRFFVNGGPSFLFAFATNLDRSMILYPDQTFSNMLYPSELVKDVNIGGVLGSGYSYQISPKTRFFTELRFIVPIIAHPTYTTDLNNTMRNLTLSLTVGMSFAARPK